MTLSSKASASSSRRKRDAVWRGEARGAVSCPHRHGQGRCGATIETRIVDGRTEFHCPACDRRRQGICRDCPRPVAGQVGKATRCAACRDRAVREALQRYAVRNADAIRRRAKLAERRRKQDPERHAQILARKRVWRKANPDRVAAAKAKDAAKNRERRLAYHRKYNAQRGEAKREYARRQYYAKHPTRPSPVCRDCHTSIPWAPPGRPPVRCQACAPVSIARQRRRIVVSVSAVPPEPLPQRTCLTCPTPLTGRAKRCEPCKAQTFVQAKKVLLGLERAS